METSTASNNSYILPSRTFRTLSGKSRIQYKVGAIWAEIDQEGVNCYREDGPWLGWTNLKGEPQSMACPSGWMAGDCIAAFNTLKEHGLL